MPREIQLATDLSTEANIGALILLVDDENAILDMLEMVLGGAGYECLRANNASEAQVMVLDHKPDLVLLDWMMPNISGLDLLRRWRRDELTAHLPVIMLTAKGEEGSKVVGLDSGADDYLSKPFSPRELQARIRSVLRRAGPENGLDR